MCVVSVLPLAKVPDTSLTTKLALNVMSGAAKYLNPWLFILTLSTAPISVVVDRRAALVPVVVDIVIDGRREYPAPPSFRNTLVISPVLTVPSSRANVSDVVP